MAQKSRPDPAAGNVISADEYEALATAYVEDGVVGHPDDTAVVYADSTGRQVKIRAGKQANVRGYEWFSDLVTDEIIGNLPANTTTDPRIDRLVMRLDRAARTVRTVYLQGAPAPTPVAPTLTQAAGNSNGLFDIPLARWQVAAGYTTIAAADIVTEAWYPQPTGPVLCTSTSRPFGASLYKGLEAYEVNTGFKQRWTGTAWERADWNEPWGVLGGKRWGTNTTLSAGISTAEIGINTDTGTVTILPGRAYRLKWRFILTSGTAGPNFYLFVVRRTNTTGAQMFSQMVYWPQQNGYGMNCSFDGSLWDLGANPVTDNFTVTCRRFSGSDNLQVGANGSGELAYCYIEDFGPLSRLTYI